MAGKPATQMIHTPPPEAYQMQPAPRRRGATCGCLALILLPLTFLVALLLLAGPQVVLITTRWLDGPVARPDLAYQILDVAELVWPESARLQDALGVANLQAGNLPRALAEFNRAVGLDPSLAPARNNLAVALLAASQPEAALTHLQAALDLDPGSSQVYLNLGNTYLKLGDLEKAQPAFQHAVDLDPAALAGWEALSEIALQRGDVPAAQAALEQILILSSDPLLQQHVRSTLDKLSALTPAYPAP
jgi:tetratricopeptide (TPR) repeat protein